MKKGSYVCEKVTCSRLRDSRVLRIEKAQTGKKKKEKRRKLGRGGAAKTKHEGLLIHYMSEIFYKIYST